MQAANEYGANGRARKATGRGGLVHTGTNAAHHIVGSSRRHCRWLDDKSKKMNRASSEVVMSIPVKYFLTLGLLLLANMAIAEDGCPPGMIPANGTNINSCVPIPVGYYSNQQQAQPQPPPPRWARRWGAIATDEPKGVLGTATGMASRSDAEQSAIANCQAKGGAPCRLEIAYDNECVALVVSSKDYSINTGDTENAANQLAMKTCGSDGDPNCHVYYSACSLPARIQ